MYFTVKIIDSSTYQYAHQVAVSLISLKQTGIKWKHFVCLHLCIWLKGNGLGLWFSWASFSQELCDLYLVSLGSVYLPWKGCKGNELNCLPAHVSQTLKRFLIPTHCKIFLKNFVCLWMSSSYGPVHVQHLGVYT